jgi:hypothetical protein
MNHDAADEILRRLRALHADRKGLIHDTAGWADRLADLLADVQQAASDAEPEIEPDLEP